MSKPKNKVEKGVLEEKSDLARSVEDKSSRLAQRENEVRKLLGCSRDRSPGISQGPGRKQVAVRLGNLRSTKAILQGCRHGLRKFTKDRTTMAKAITTPRPARTRGIIRVAGRGWLHGESCLIGAMAFQRNQPTHSNNHRGLGTNMPSPLPLHIL